MTLTDMLDYYEDEFRYDNAMYVSIVMVIYCSRGLPSVWPIERRGDDQGYIKFIWAARRYPKEWEGHLLILTVFVYSKKIIYLGF